LRQVSRSFYLSLAILPTALREPIGLAYLLARAADTIADTELVARKDRLAHLETVRRACGGEPADVAAVARACAPPPHRVTHRKRLGDWALREMSEEGVSFGKALQLTNVLRDVPGDLAHGRCYLPARELAALGMGPRDLLDPAGAARALPLYRRLIGLALEHYNVGWDYTLAIPRL